MNNIIPDGLIYRFFQFIGYSPTTYSEQFLSYLLVSTFFICASVLMVCLIFRLICYINKR